MVGDDRYPVTKAEISLENLAWNYRQLKSVKAPAADMMAVVKADGYGHGASQVARVALQEGCKMLAVARFSEALNLRRDGIEAPVLLFGYSHPENAALIDSLNFRATINSFSAAQELNEKALELGKKIKVHIKVDSGMGRLGLPVDHEKFILDFDKNSQTLKSIMQVASMKGLEIEGIYTHFANADAFDKTHAYWQLELFSQLLDSLKSQGFEVKYRHAANSAALMEMPESHFDLVRPGVAQYGLYPSGEVDQNRIELRPAMTIKSTAIHVKDVPAGFKISYGSTYETPSPAVIATVPIGYADGYSRSLSSKGFMVAGGVKVPIVGRVCMDLTMIDVSSAGTVRTGDEIVVLGAQNGVAVTADDIASQIGTINYEVVSSITSRVPRFYV